MPGSVLLDLHAGRLEKLHEAVDAWRQHVYGQQRSPQELARSAREAAGVVAAALEIPGVVRSLWESTVDLVPLGGITDYATTGERLFKSFDQALAILHEMDDLTRTFAGAGRPIPRADELAEAIRQVETLKGQALEFWPYSAAAVADGLAEHGRGETVELSEAFAGIAGLSKEEWLRRVEAHKRAKGS